MYAAELFMNLTEGLVVVVLAIVVIPFVTALVARVWFTEKLKFLSRLTSFTGRDSRNSND